MDESALLEGLTSGHLGGAALDVLAGEFDMEFENSLSNSSLVQYACVHDNIIITPHYGGATIDARQKIQTVKLIIKSIYDS